MTTDTNKPRLLAIDGSYRVNGIVQQAIDVLTTQFQDEHYAIERIHLADSRIEFCTNCRECTQMPGLNPGECSLNDDMLSLIGKIEQADAFILAAPVNFGTVTALYKRFLERLICYAYWPWEKPYPDFRKKTLAKPAILLTSSAMPGNLARYLTSAMNSLKFTAKTIGARPVKRIFLGRAANKAQHLGTGDLRRLTAASKKLI